MQQLILTSLLEEQYLGTRSDKSDVSRGGGNSHIKRGGMLVVPLRGVIFGIWS